MDVDEIGYDKIEAVKAMCTFNEVDSKTKNKSTQLHKFCKL